MSFRVDIPRTANDAFDEAEGNAGPELARILRKLADRVEGGVPTGDSASILDIDGNWVGEWEYVSDSD